MILDDFLAIVCGDSAACGGETITHSRDYQEMVERGVIDRTLNNAAVTEIIDRAYGSS